MLSRKRIVMVSNAIKTHEESPCGERALQIEKAVLRRHARPPRPHRVAHRAHHTRTSSNRAPKRPCHPRAVSSARDARLSRTTKKKPPSDEKIARDNIPRAPLFRVYANHAFPETRSLRATQKQSSSTHRLLYVILAVMMVLP